MRYTYRGILTNKNPFDLALYQLLLWERKPRTLIEIGSKSGGSALWFADVLRSFNIDYAIHSIDINPPAQREIAGVTFHKGDGNSLADTLSPDLMSSFARPIMVVEDADHRAITTLNVLRFFDRWLRPDEYIVIEDGIVTELFGAGPGSPRAAIRDFLSERGEDYEIDTRICDFFGTNTTWNVNGYLRRTG
jgi:cephalosporin hydroxylase